MKYVFCIGIRAADLLQKQIPNLDDRRTKITHAAVYDRIPMQMEAPTAHVCTVFAHMALCVGESILS